MHVLEHEHERTLAAERLEEAADGPAPSPAGAVPFASPTSSNARCATSSASSVSARRPQIEALDHLAERQVRRTLAVGDAAAGQHRRLALDERDQLVGEARLADAGLADDGHDLRRRLALRLLEDGEQPPKLVFAADELRPR